MVRLKMEDIARLAGVSKSTVSQYLNKRYEFMSEETRKRIEEVIQKTGYLPNALARSLKVKKTHTIGVIVASILYDYSTAVMRGIEDYCNLHQYNVFLCNADHDPEKERKYLEMLFSKQVDGLILASTGENNELLRQYIKRGFPIVLIDRRLDDVPADGVFSNNFQGALDLVHHLIRLGHRKIALLSPELREVSSRKERYGGYMEALQTARIPYRPEYVKFVKNIKETALRVDELLEHPDPPTALICSNDETAMKALKRLQEREVKIPEQLAFAMFDDSPWAHLMNPPLTCVKQQTYEIGMQSAQILLERIANPKKRRIIKQLDCKLQVRKSCSFQ